MEYYLAIDIGASSGRHILGCISGGSGDGGGEKIELAEIHRFSNEMISVERNGAHALCWDLDKLFACIIEGLKKCKEIGKIPKYIGIDTWAVDFVLLDSEDNIIGDSVAYRDKRTEGMDAKVNEIISASDLYARTGIQKQLFNSIYQLMAIKTRNPEHLEAAETFLMLPEYFNFLLTGIKKNEYTNATSTQLISPFTKTWDAELINQLGYPQHIFNELSLPGSVVGELSSTVSEEVGYNATVLLPATHDTASAVVAVPEGGDDTIYLSSGTWSLIGIESPDANCSQASMKANFTNEGGYNYQFRYLKNIMGLWLLQCVKKELNNEFSFDNLREMAERESIQSMVDCNDNVFYSPQSMIEEIKNYCIKTNQQVPQAPGEIAAIVYNSLAKCYADAVKELEELTGKSYKNINIVGGGSQSTYLNKLTARYTGKHVIAGPVEATALGNLVVQMIATGKFKDLEEARKCIRRML